MNNFKKSELKIDILLSKDICNLRCMFKDCHSLLKFSIKDNKENEEINNDILQIEKINDELEYNLNEIFEYKGSLNEGLKDNIIDCKYSEVSKKEQSSKEESLYSEIHNFLINNKSDEIIYKNESISYL